jgi:microcin C transport system substrate-binding protein
MSKCTIYLITSILLIFSFLSAEFDYVTIPPGADPAVSAEDGGNGFEKIAASLGYQTHLFTDEDIKFFGDEKAVKGGLLHDFASRFPATMRLFGKEANYLENYWIEILCYEPLLELHPLTYEPNIPRLASHWKISDDKKKFWFRINPDARWADGRRVTADDVVATWFLRMDETILDPSQQVSFGKFEEPLAESMYIVSVVAKDTEWRNFQIFASGMSILPAYYVDQVDGSEYLEKYQFSMMPNSGPYILKNKDIINQESYKLTRRDDFWAKDHIQNRYRFNFDAISWFVIKDNATLPFEKFKKGEFDYFEVARSARWVEDCVPEKMDAIDKGWMKKHRIFSNKPSGTSGYGFNMRKFPFNDKNIRYAFSFLYDREEMNEKMYYNEYEMMHSWFSGTEYENFDNQKFLFNADSAMHYLKLAGFEKKNKKGILINKEGTPLSISINIQKTSAYMVTPVQNKLRQYGVDMQIVNMDGTTEWKNRQERNFTIYMHNFTGGVHPSIEQWFRSDLADMNDNNNFFGFKSDRVDNLIKVYNSEFDLDERIKIGKEIDYIVCETHPVAFGIKRLYRRFLYWDKFGYPEYMIDRFVGNRESIFFLWWFDPKKEARLETAMNNDTSLPVGDVDIKFWPNWNKKNN